MNLKARLDAEFFPFVIRPARYIGNEWGAVPARAESKAVRMAICVPEKYERAMGKPDLHALYRRLNASATIDCERVFLPDIDAVRILKERQLPLFTLESISHVSECDWVHFLIDDPLSFPHVLTMLDLARVARFAKDRSVSDTLVSASFTQPSNPAPIESIFDFFCIGDIETIASQLSAVITQRTVLGRKAVLQQIAKIPGVSTSLNNETVRAVPDSRKGFENIIPIQAYEEVSNDNLTVTIPPTFDYYRTATTVAETVQQTGYDEIVIDADLDAGVKNFDQFCNMLGQKLRDQHATVFLPSLPITQHSLDYAKSLVFGEKQSIRFNLKSGSERLRESHGLYTSLEQFYQTLANAYAHGWKSVRMDIELGLPQESDDDLDATIEFIRNCDEVRSEYGEKAYLIVSITPFTPQPHTEWQWDAVITPDEYQRRCELIQRRARGRNIQYRVRSAEESFLRAVISRCDNNLICALERLTDAFTTTETAPGNDSIDTATWRTILTESGIYIDKLASKSEIGSPTPWDRWEFRQSREKLAQRRKTAFPETVSKRSSGGFKLGDIILAKPALAEQILAPVQTTPTASFGRKPKRILSEPTPMIVPRSRIRLMWSKDDSVRFVGHLATMRVFERACRRSSLPVAYSQGTKPRPKLSFGPPLTLGYTSLGEFLDIQLDMPFQDAMLEKLNQALPVGFQVIQGRPVFGKATSVSSLINLSAYEITLSADTSITGSAIGAVLVQPSVVVKRIKGDDVSEIDVRSSIFKIELRHTTGVNILYMELGMGNQGFVRPDEVLSTCFGLSERDILRLKICRTALMIVAGENRLSPFEVSS